MKLKDYITESFKKEYSYRIKLAADCNDEHLNMLEKCLAKYDVVSVSPFKRKPIQENPVEFVRAKGVKCISEVCSTDIILKYPVNQRILEVWVAVNLGVDHERVLCYGINEPRRLESENAEERTEYNKDRVEEMDDAVLLNSDDGFEHYEMQNEEVDVEEFGFGETYNKKFLDQLAKIKAEKGADYFRNYPGKDQLMGDDLRPMFDDMMNSSNMGKGQETKHVSVNSQNLGH
jgi:hypothetical protein